jgi:pantetheine-phosphate adenylyltransferase
MTLAIYPGSFDPITNGHLDVALRAARLFDSLILTVYEGHEKPNQLFPVAERVTLVREAIAALSDPAARGIEVGTFSGLAVNYARARGASTIVRGLRAVSDFEYEFKYAHMNEHLAPEIEVVCLMTSSRLSFISSSFIREVAGLGGDIHGLVPDNVERAILARTQAKPELLPTR